MPDRKLAVFYQMAAVPTGGGLDSTDTVDGDVVGRREVWPVSVVGQSRRGPGEGSVKS